MAKRLNYAQVLRTAWFRAQPDIEPSPLSYQDYLNKLRYIEWQTRRAFAAARQEVPRGS